MPMIKFWQFCVGDVSLQTPSIWLSQTWTAWRYVSQQNILRVCHVLTEILIQDGIAPTIFTIALGNYVIPCVSTLVLRELANVLLLSLRLTRLIINVTLILLAVILPGWFSGAYIIFVANFVTIIGIVLATVWAITQKRMLRVGGASVAS